MFTQVRSIFDEYIINKTTKGAYNLCFSLLTFCTSCVGPKFTYDQEGQLVTATRAGRATHMAHAAGRLTRAVEATYTHDDGGRRVARELGGQRRRYVYDSGDRLLEVYDPSGRRVRFDYDAWGRRARREVAGQVTRFVWDQDHLLAELDAEGVCQVRYVWGDGADELLAILRPGQSPRYVHADHLGSVRALTDERGEVVARYAYTAYGELLQADGPQAETCPYRYTGRRWEPSAELYYYRARDYDPATARFLTRDPAGWHDTHRVSSLFHGLLLRRRRRLG